MLLIGLFVLDLSIIHPFDDGNGRVARALTNALLIEQGCAVSRYVSLEELIADSADAYYQALLDLDARLARRQGRPVAVAALLRVGVLASGYEIFAARAAADRNRGSNRTGYATTCSTMPPTSFASPISALRCPGSATRRSESFSTSFELRTQLA